VFLGVVLGLDTHRYFLFASGSNAGLIAGIVVPLVILACLAAVGLFFFMKRRKQHKVYRFETDVSVLEKEAEESDEEAEIELPESDNEQKRWIIVC